MTDETPYVLYSHDLVIGGRTRRIWICSNLMDHRCLGVALNREDAIAHMRRVTAHFGVPTPGELERQFALPSFPPDSDE